MRTLLSLALVFLLPLSAAAAEITTEISVRGNCGMCKKTIEKAATSVEGVGEATWNKKTKKLRVTFDDALTSKDEIVQTILDAGYDADGKKADDDAYNELATCCQYRE